MDFKTVVKAQEFISDNSDVIPRVGIIIGTGLEGIIDSIDVHDEIPYENIPGFVSTTLSEHKGMFILGELSGVDVAVMNGRFHVYEGYSMQEVVFPVYAMKEAGISHLIVSNAAGGINPEYKAGSLVLVRDHINLMGSSPLIGTNDDRMGPRYPDMFNAYSPEIRSIAQQAAEELGICIKQGVYTAVKGPNLETPAEYKWLRTIGADLVGMSTVPEIIAGVHCGLKNCCISVVTDECWPEALKEVDIQEIVETATCASGPLCSLVERIVEKVGE